MLRHADAKKTVDFLSRVSVLCTQSEILFEHACPSVCPTNYRRLADGDVHCAASATYEIFLGYRSRTLTRSLTLNPNPNPITDPNPNPKINKKQNDTRMKLNIELYLKVDFLGTGADL